MIITLTSPFTPTECEARLRGAINEEGPLSIFGSKRMVGRVAGGAVRLRVKGKSTVTLTGTLEPCESGTIFLGQFQKTDRSLKVFAVIAAMMLVVVGVFSVVGYFTGPNARLEQLLVPFLLCLPVGGFITAFAIVIRLVAERDQRLLMGLMADALGGSSGAPLA